MVNRFFISSILLFSVALLAAMGFFMAGHVHSFSMPCPVSSSLGGACPSSNSALAWAMHHLSGLKEFTLSVVGIAGFSGFSLVFLSFAITAAFFKTPRLPKLSCFSNEKFYALLDNTFFEPFRKLFLWLSLLNKKDALLVARAHSCF